MRHDTLINRWRGGRAKIWSYAVSHKVLTIRVEIDGRKGNLHIGCGDVCFIHGPTDWDDADFEIEQVGSDYILRDKKAGFEARAGVVEVAENCKPIF